MPSVSEFRNGMAIRWENEVFVVVEFQHLTPGNLRAMLRTKLKNLRTGRIQEVTFRMSDKVDEVRLEEKKMQFLYASDGLIHLMDTDTYDQTFISEEMLGDAKRFLKEEMMLSIFFLEGKPVSADVPTFVELKVTFAEPGVKGDSATNITKFATVETGTQVQVPLFVKEGDTLKIDTRTGRYVERLSIG